MKRIATLLLASTSVAACAPLSQAGLVYASRGQAGVTLASGTPETPGLELSIGMKTADFAYIPVVVGRPCEFRRDGGECNQELVRVFGTHNAQSQTADDPPPPSPTAPGPAGGPKAMPNDSSTQDGEPPVPTPAPEAAGEAAAERIANVIAKLTTSNRQEDSYSVYGTFNSTGNASAPAGGGSGNTGLSLGRVFSTGVAAQNLSNGQRVSVLNQCMAQAVSSAGDNSALKQQLLAACAAAAGRP